MESVCKALHEKTDYPGKNNYFHAPYDTKGVEKFLREICTALARENFIHTPKGKRLKELALMEQPFIRDGSITVEELVKQVGGKIGENVQVRRFTRYTLGEGIEIETTDFATEVASMSAS